MAESIFARKTLASAPIFGYKSPTQFLNDWVSAQHEENWQHETHVLEDEKPGGSQTLSDNILLCANSSTHFFVPFVDCNLSTVKVEMPMGAGSIS